MGRSRERSRERLRASSGEKDGGEDWYCEKCDSKNYSSHTVCRNCERSRTRSKVRGIRSSGSGVSRVDELAAKKSRQVEKIRKVDTRLSEVDAQLAELRQKRRSALVASRAEEEALLSLDTQELIDSVLAMNVTQAKAAHASTPAVASAEEAQQNMDGTRPILAAAKELRPRIKQWIREHKLVAYKKSRVLGETWAKTQPHWLSQRVKEVRAPKPAEAPGSAFMSPTTSTIRSVVNDEAFENKEIDAARFVDTLAPRVAMVMDRRLAALTYTFDDRTQLVKDPLKADEEWRQRFKWNDNERNAFVRLYQKHHKKFHVISTMSPFHISDVAPKTTRDIVAFYYANKHRLVLKNYSANAKNKRASQPMERVIRRVPSTPNMPRELLNLGITSDEEFVAYLVGQNSSTRRRTPVVRHNTPPPSPPRIKRRKKRKEKKEEDEEEADDDDDDDDDDENGAVGDQVVEEDEVVEEDDEEGYEPAPAKRRKKKAKKEKTEQEERDSSSEIKEEEREGEKPVKQEQEEQEDAGGTKPMDIVEEEPDVAVKVEPNEPMVPQVELSARTAKLFRESLAEHGAAWSDVARDTGRPAKVCLNYFIANADELQSLVDGSEEVRKGLGNPWTPENKASLVSAVGELGQDWAKVAERLLHHSAGECENFFKANRYRLFQ